VNVSRIGLTALVALAAARSPAQAADTGLRPVSRSDAVAEALANGTRFKIALADTTAARGAIAAATAYPNPALAAGYSKATPQYHLSLDQPIEYPGLRSARADAARELQRGSHYRFVLERASLQVEADTAYTAALAALGHARLSAVTARAADSLLTLAKVRRDAGDASDLEVELASVNALQAANASTNDSVAAVAATLALQGAMGIGAERERIALTDSLTPAALPPLTAPLPGASAAPPLLVASAEANALAASHALSVEQNSVFSTPSLTFGFDTHDPSGAEPGILPVVGVSLPLPLWYRRNGEIGLAQAGVYRAQAELAQARRESDAAIARARRDLAAANARVARDGNVLASARRVASMSLTAYAEGAAGIPTVLEAQRTARDAVAHYLDDLAAAQIAFALLTLHSLPAQ
jgi:cobalt-zinc-cadmium efflux system outer membrane protein